MRRILPLLILVVGLAALAADFLTIPRPFSTDPCSPPTSTAGCIDTRLGLDLQGGLRGEYQALPTADHAVTADDMANIKTIIENRINQYGVAEPVVQTQGSDRIVVEIPGVTDVEAVRSLIGSTGLLQFVPIPRGTTGIGQGTHLGTVAELPGQPPNHHGGLRSVQRRPARIGCSGRRFDDRPTCRQLHAQGHRRDSLRQVRAGRLLGQQQSGQ